MCGDVLCMTDLYIYMYHNIRSLIIIIIALQRVHRPDLVWYVAASIYWLVVSNAIHIMYDYICTEYGEILSPKCYDSASQSTVVSLLICSLPCLGGVQSSSCSCYCWALLSAGTILRGTQLQAHHTWDLGLTTATVSRHFTSLHRHKRAMCSRIWFASQVISRVCACFSLESVPQSAPLLRLPRGC